MNWNKRQIILFALTAAALLAAEHAALSHEPEICATVVRLGAIYGPGRDLSERIGRAAGTRRTDGRPFVNLIHSDDVVAALGKLLNHRHHGPLNLVNDKPISRQELYDTVLKQLALEPVTWDEPTDIPPAGLGKRVGNDLIKRTLGLSLEHPSFTPSP